MLRILEKKHVGSETGYVSETGSGYGSETNWKVGSGCGYGSDKNHSWSMHNTGSNLIVACSDPESAMFVYEMSRV